MDPDTTALLRELADRSPSEREAYCAQHAVPAALRAEVESLLGFGDGAGDSPDGRVAAARLALAFDRTSTIGAAPTNDSFSVSGLAHESLHGRFPPGTLLAGRYRIITLLGRGGMGEVYRADDLTLKQPVALKFLPERPGAAPPFFDRLHAEVRLARQISHPNVCRVYDIATAAGAAFISMQYIDGEDLASLLRRIGRLPHDKAIEIARRLCVGLAAAHDKGVVHRDLKPSNIMIDGRGQVLITDFGLAARSRDGEPVHGLSGTPAYMAPEQLRGHGASFRSDLYSLGLVLGEMFTGSRPSGDERTAAETGARLRRIAADVDPVVVRAIACCLDADPGRRPASALEVAGMLPGGNPLADALAAGITPSPDVVAASRETTAMSVRAIVGSLVLIVAGMAATSLLFDRVGLMAVTPFENPPDVLERRARDLIAALGYDGRAEDSARGFYQAGNYQRFAELRMPRADYEAQLRLGRPALVFFWYRQSPRPLNPSDPLSHVNHLDPPTVPGEIVLWMDQQGRLGALHAVPSENDYSLPSRAPDWDAVLEAAGVDRAGLVPVDAGLIPAVTFDARAAWTARSRDAPSAARRIEAAAWRGRPVYYRAIGSWTSVQGQVTGLTRTMATMSWLFVPLQVVILAAGALVARRNLRLGRGDTRGAFRLGIVLFGTVLIEWALTAQRIVVPGRPAMLWAIAYALTLAVAAWVFYVAVEPFLRRYWPQALITWARVLAGDVRDPLVGAHVLAGAAFGVAIAVGFGLRSVLFRWTGAVAWIPDTATLLGGASMIAAALSVFERTVVFSLGMFVVLLLLLVVLRRRWIAAVAFVALYTGFFALISVRPTLEALCTIPVGVLLLWMMMRFGVLLLIVASFVSMVLISFPMTSHWSAWYAGATLFAVGMVLALVAWSSRVALAGRKVLRDELLEPAG